MFNRSILLKILSVIPITILCNVVPIVTVIMGDTISATINSFFDMFLSLNYTDFSVNREKTNIACSMFGLAQPIIFNFLFGTYIYNDLHISSIYLFVRQSNKTKWFLRKTTNLFLFASVYCLLQVLIPFITAFVNSKSPLNGTYIIQFAAVFLSFLFLTYLSTLLINIIAISLGSAFGFLFTYMVMILCFYHSVKSGEYYILNGMLSMNKFNPIDNSIVLWQNGMFDIAVSMAINLLYISILIMLGIVMVNKVDVSLTNQENII